MQSSSPPSGSSPESQSPSHCSCLRLPVTGTLDDVVCLLGHEGELHDSGGELFHGHGGLPLHQDAAPRRCVHVVVLVLELLLGLVHLGRGGGHLLKDLLES